MGWRINSLVMKKIGANDPCPCGSGKKFKKCCRDLPFVGFREVEKRLTAQHHQISEQQGLGRKIISCLAGENRVIAVGNKVFLSKKWQTFHDFLFSYVLDLFGRDWLEKENSKPYEERHPFIEWYRLAVEDRNSASKNTNNKIFTLSPSGAGQAFLRLSYGLYLLAHNLEIQNILLKRLKNKDKFIGTFHEISVTSAFIVAGFSIEIENKENSSVSHCEFNAFYPLTNERFSIEVKARELGKTSVRDLLYKALKKEVKYFRVIFIALTLEDMKDDKLQETYNEVIACENGLTINGNNTPPAYVFVYNNQYLAKLKDKDSKNAGFMVGYKIDDLKRNSFFKNLRDGFKSIQKHKAMFQVFEEIKIGARIPSTFDGEIPEFAFNPEL
ncbi:MAG: SEC-C domain-containing protein, partial [Syntrophomonadaceae bacterium]|nr:SEC-C domain-containing protein [Syntrophomonadaceae bacterium]